MPGWDPIDVLLRNELVQRREEGCDVTGFPEKVEAAIQSGEVSRIEAVYDALMALEVQPGFPFSEPSDLDAIRAKCPPGPRTLTDRLSKAAWADKFLGAWLGRCAGCALGKPVESWPFMSGEGTGNPGWKNVYRWFAEAGAWPMRGYTPGQSPFSRDLGPDFSLPCPNSQRENIQFMESDDDLRYTVLGLSLLEQYGDRFTTWEVGRHWHRYLTYGQVCTAETQAYLNFARVTSHSQGWRGEKPADWQEKLAWVRTYRNPFREWIGAQIRADGLAYGAAGQPQRAAEFAWRDASLSHVKNGIYGEMYVAAMIAAAFIEPDMEKVVQIGLSEIPASSRLYRDIQQAISITAQARSQGQSQLQLVEKIWDAFCHYHPVHTNNNAALVTAALLFARGDFETAITTAVLGGWDTDCNGATVGSIMGAALGGEALPESWIEPLNDTLYAEVIGFHPIPISTCAQRSAALFWRLKGEG